MSKVLMDQGLQQKTIQDKNYLWVAMGIVLCSLVPFIHYILTDSEVGNPRDWVPNVGIVDFLTLEDGTVLGYADYGIFLFITGLHFSVFLGWLLALYLGKNKPYRFAFLFPTILTGYQLFIIVFGYRDTELNDLTPKIILFILIGAILVFKFSLKNKYLWLTLGIVFCSLLPFLHDILTDNELGNPKAWVPNLRLVKYLTLEDGSIWGYSDYGIFLFIIGLYLSMFFAWFMALHLARFKPYRFAFFFPVVLNGYQLFLIIFKLRATELNNLSSKIMVFIVLGILLVLNFFLNKKKRKSY